MKIMTFNIAHCLSYGVKERKIDFELMASVIKNSGADVVGLNEVRDKGVDSDYIEQAVILSELTGLNHRYFAKAIDFDGVNPYGNALLSRYPIISAQTLLVEDPPIKGRVAGGYYETRCLLKAKLECGLTVLAIHFGLNPDEQANAVKLVLENLEDERCVLMGDFNVMPENKLLEPIKARMKDAASCFKAPLLSFPSDIPDRKIDYVFVSKDIELISADIPAIVASDHRPHVAEINF